jgi:hypothetical protein
MKTPMQELIDEMTYILTEGGERDICALREKARKLLEKEKQVIMDAYMEGGDWESLPQPRFDNYYNQTFNTKER